jgi:hypothetical protein
LQLIIGAKSFVSYGLDLLKDGVNNWVISLLMSIVYGIFDLIFQEPIAWMADKTSQRFKKYDIVWNCFIQTFSLFLPDVIGPILPSIILQKKTTLNPENSYSESVYFFMSYEWFNTVALDITMIYISQMIKDILVEYFGTKTFLQQAFWLLLDSRTCSNHSLFTFMPQDYPLVDRMVNILTLVLGCAIAGFFSPIVFLLFSGYVLIFMAIEMDNAFIYKRLRSLNPKCSNTSLLFSNSPTSSLSLFRFCLSYVSFT